MCSWASRECRRPSSPASCCASSRPGSRCGCSWSSRSRSASATSATPSSTRSAPARSTCPTPRGSPSRCTAGAAPTSSRSCPLSSASPAAGPRGLARALATAGAQALRDRRTRFSGPRKIYVKELLQAIALADRLIDAPDVRHLHAHFAHGTTTITWHAARITGLPFSFTGHARDIYAEHLNPKGWLRRKLLAARFVVTCTEANVRHLRAIAPEAEIHLVYHGLNADFARLLREQDGPAASGNGDLRVLAVGRHVAKKGFDVLIDACAVLRSRGVPFEAAVIGQEDKHSSVVKEHIARHGLGDHVRLAGPMGQAELLREYRRASALCMPSRLLHDDRDGIPNVLVEAMAAGTPVIASAVSGIPELVEHEVNGLLVEPEDPEALADTLLRLRDDPAFSRALAENGRETVERRFDGPRQAVRIAELFQAAVRT